MGADLVFVYYGVKRTIAIDDDEQVRQLEDESHPIFNLAFENKLHVTWGRLTDGADNFLLIGNEIGQFGLEGVAEATLSDGRANEIMENTKARLKAAGIDEPPQFHFQLHAQY